jgi:hypothetical protein
MTGYLLSAVLFCAPPADGPSPVLIPEQQIPLTFSHQLHLKKNIACEYCHEKAPESTSASDFLIPKEESCTDCHPIDHKQPEKQAKIAARCDACHPGYKPEMGENVARVVVPAPHLKFNHKIHVDQKMPCQKCHGEMTDVTLATREQLPRMEMCLKCHIGGSKHAPSRCATCHVIKPSGTMQLTFSDVEGKLAPSGAIRGDSHTPEFRRNHAYVARSDEQYCLNCHRKDECLSCHNGVFKPMDIHANDYVSIHSTEARRDTLRCQACHRMQSFCLGCHQRSGVALDPPGGIADRPTASPLKFHPDGWADIGVAFRGDKNHHAWQAQRNIRACVSCHREQTCVRCHASSHMLSDGVTKPFDSPYQNGLNPMAKESGISPHPRHWGGKCQALAARNQRVCLKCHLVGDPQWNCMNAQ